MGRRQRTKDSGRFSERQLRFIKKVAAAGNKNPQKAKLYIILLAIIILWFRLFSFCKKYAAVLIVIVLCVGLLVAWSGTKRTADGRADAPDSDRQILDRQQEALRGLRDEVFGESAPEVREEAFVKALMEENGDVVGWLTIPDTGIDYPVMQTPDEEDYYLYRDFYGNENQNGSLLLSAGCDTGNEKANWIIHGHNMKSGEMFGGLSEYRKKSYMKKHKLIFLDTLAGRRTYEVIAVFESQVYYENDYVFKYYQCYDIESWEEFDSFYSNIKRLSLYDTGVNAVYGDHFLTLSTCAYHTENGRFVVVAKELY